MTTAADYAKVFRAASNGVMYPFYGSPEENAVRQQFAQQQGQSFWAGPSFDGAARDQAKCIQGAFMAIAEVFEKIAEAEAVKAKEMLE